MSDHKIKLLSSAEFAELCDVRKSTLRFYRDNNVLLPKEIQKNGYGKYAPLQGLDVLCIRLLEDCGVGLDEIREDQSSTSYCFPFDEILDRLIEEQRFLSAKTTMLTLARYVAAESVREGCFPELRRTEARYYLFQKYCKPSNDIEYNLIHSIKLLCRLSRSYLGISPILMGRVIRDEDLRCGRSNKVAGLVVPISEELYRSGEIPQECLMRTEPTNMLCYSYLGEPYAFREPYEKVYHHIRENGLEICGPGLELWTGSSPNLNTGYPTLIEIPVRRREEDAGMPDAQ